VIPETHALGPPRPALTNAGVVEQRPSRSGRKPSTSHTEPAQPKRKAEYSCCCAWRLVIIWSLSEASRQPDARPRLWRFAGADRLDSRWFQGALLTHISQINGAAFGPAPEPGPTSPAQPAVLSVRHAPDAVPFLLRQGGDSEPRTGAASGRRVVAVLEAAQARFATWVSSTRCTWSGVQSSIRWSISRRSKTSSVTSSRRRYSR